MVAVILEDPGFHRIAEDVRCGLFWLRILKTRLVRSYRGYKGIKVLDEPLRTNTAILAMLAVLQIDQIDKKNLRKALTSVGPPLYESLVERWWEGWWGEAGEEGHEFNRVLQSSYLGFILALLYYYRPKFDDLPHKDQVALIEDTCTFTNKLISAAHRLANFLEFGVPGKDSRRATETASRDVQIAVLKEVEGLSNPKIGKMLNIRRSESDKKKGELSAVAGAAKRGRKILEGGLGRDGWRNWLEGARAEKSRWESLSYHEKIMQLYADRLGISVDEARQHREEARQRGQRALWVSDLGPEDALDPFYRRDIEDDI